MADHAKSIIDRGRPPKSGYLWGRETAKDKRLLANFLLHTMGSEDAIGRGVNCSIRRPCDGKA